VHIADNLRTKIQAGRRQVGDRLPTMADLQLEYGAKGTMTKAVSNAVPSVLL
jgi:DNA-binding GntR family transcriptional regulator